jgi:hypothetical protein
MLETITLGSRKLTHPDPKAYGYQNLHKKLLI